MLEIHFEWFRWIFVGFEGLLREETRSGPFLTISISLRGIMTKLQFLNSLGFFCYTFVGVWIFISFLRNSSLWCSSASFSNKDSTSVLIGISMVFFLEGFCFLLPFFTSLNLILKSNQNRKWDQDLSSFLNSWAIKSLIFSWWKILVSFPILVGFQN